MKGNNRGMFYSNYQAGGFNDPNMIPNTYNINSQYQAYGPGVNPGMMMPSQEYGETNDYNERLTKIERQIRNLDQRIRKLETSTTIDDNSINDSNLYMI